MPRSAPMIIAILLYLQEHGESMDYEDLLSFELFLGRRHARGTIRRMIELGALQRVGDRVTLGSRANIYLPAVEPDYVMTESLGVMLRKEAEERGLKLQEQSNLQSNRD